MNPTPVASDAARGSASAHSRPTASTSYKWVYLWGWPIRITHWLSVASIILLIVTGFYIGAPYFITSGEASSHYLMGTMRFQRWAALFPVRPRDWINLWKQVQAYLMIHPEGAPSYLGHNPLQQLSYTALYACAIIEIVTGFTLYGQYLPGRGWYLLLDWVGDVMGGLPIVRFIHHVLTWVFLVFIPVHIYLALRADLLEHTGTISSIVSGGRFVRTDVPHVDGSP